METFYTKQYLNFNSDVTRCWCLPKQPFFFPPSLPWHLLLHWCRRGVIQTALGAFSASADLVWQKPKHLCGSAEAPSTAICGFVSGLRARVHLVGVVGADVAECRWRRLAEQRWGMVLETIHADVFRMRDVGEQRWEGGRRADCGWGGGREVGQTLCEAVHVDLDLWVVKVFLSIAVVRVTVPAVREKEVDLLGFHKLMLLIMQLGTSAANAWISEY